MTTNTSDFALLLVKKFGGMALILFGILAVGLEYRSTGLSFGLIAAGIVALVGSVYQTYRLP